MVSPNSSLLHKFPPSLEIDMEDILNCGDPPDFDWISHEDPNQRYVKVEFAAPTPPNMANVDVHASNEFALSNYCRFAQAIHSLPPMKGFNADFDLGVKQGDST